MPAFPVLSEGFAYGGEAFGRLPDGKICFFRGGVPGETAEVELTLSKRSFARGVLKRVSAPGAKRIVPRCPYAVRPGTCAFCPGCSFQQISYTEELSWKQRQLSDFLVRGNLAEMSALASPVAAPSRFGWRNRLKLSAAEDRIGFFSEDNRTVIDIEHCPLAVPEIDAALPAHRRELKDGEVFFRWTPRDGVVVNGGDRILTEHMQDFGDFSVPAASFFQTNPQVAAQLAHGVAETLRRLGVGQLWELYCGVGVFSLIAAQEIPGLCSFGVELDASAIDCAVRNARTRGMAERCRFEVGNAEKWRTLPRGMKPDAVLVDPPRRGLSERLTEALKRWRVPHVIYISCAPDTLARDLRRLKDHYRVARCRLYDMFPATGHFETLAQLDLQ